MKQVFIAGRFPPPIDGQTLATRRLAELLDARYDVRRIDTGPPASAHVSEGARMHPARIMHFLRLRSSLRSTFRSAPQATVLWPSVSPVPNGHFRDLLTFLPAFYPEQRIFGIVHWGNFDRLFRSRLTRVTARKLTRRLSGFVFLDGRLSDRCADWIPEEKRFVIPNTISDELVFSDREVEQKQSIAETERPLRLLFLSNMIPSKGYLDVLEAVRLLRDRGLPVVIDFAGRWVSDSSREEFSRQVLIARLQENVTHHGGIDHPSRVKELYRHADAFILPTYYPTEAQPLSIIEALNAATPVITTRHAGIPEMITHGVEGRFVPPQNAEAIADAITRLRDRSYWTSLSVGARHRFIEHFSPDAVRQKWESLLKRSFHHR